jgi:hypothetical protein
MGQYGVILLARVVPETLTPELDDPELEARFEQAIKKVEAGVAKGARKVGPIAADPPCWVPAEGTPLD